MPLFQNNDFLQNLSYEEEFDLNYGLARRLVSTQATREWPIPIPILTDMAYWPSYDRCARVNNICFVQYKNFLWRDNLKQDCLVQQCSEIILLIHFFIGCMCVSGYTLVTPYLYHFQRKPVSSLQMNDHIEESCPYTKVQCTFALVGCQVKVCCVISVTKKYKSFSVFLTSYSFKTCRTRIRNSVQENRETPS